MAVKRSTLTVKPRNVPTMNTATAQPVPLTLPDVPQKTVQKQNAALLPVTADPFRIITNPL